jgi:ribosomal protein L27
MGSERRLLERNKSAKKKRGSSNINHRDGHARQLTLPSFDLGVVCARSIQH